MIEKFRMCTEENYVTRQRLKELAILFKDGLILDDQETAIEYFTGSCEMSESEMKYFGIGGG